VTQVEKAKVDNDLAQKVRRVVEPAVSGAGLFLEDVKITGAGVSQVVQVTVDLPETEVGSLGSDQLGDVARAVSAAMDLDDVVPGQYALEVSTPGATRPLKELRHFRRAVTRLIKMKLHDGRELVARLKAVNGDGDDATLTVETDKDGESQIAVKDVRKAKVELEMKRALNFDFGDDDFDFDDEEADN
jgi:ribosome maturation factor RimP